MKKYVYSEANQVVVCGDIHGAFETLVYKACVQYSMTDTVIIVAGDCGFGFEMPNYYTTLYNRLAGRLSKANNWVVFVRGNHDDPSYFNEEKVSYERFRCVPDYSVINVSGRNILCVGGAVSIDRKYRRAANVRLELKEVACYWPDELPVFDLSMIETISESCSIDTIVTHTAPSFCPLQDKHGVRAWLLSDPELFGDLDKERDIMDKIYYELIKYIHPLEHWYYGHFHESASTNIDNIIFKMLDVEEMCELHRR